jgi:hypothetical protein
LIFTRRLAGPMTTLFLIVRQQEIDLSYYDHD